MALWYARCGGEPLPHFTVPWKPEEGAGIGGRVVLKGGWGGGSKGGVGGGGALWGEPPPPSAGDPELFEAPK